MKLLQLGWDQFATTPTSKADHLTDRQRKANRTLSLWPLLYRGLDLAAPGFNCLLHRDIPLRLTSPPFYPEIDLSTFLPPQRDKYTDSGERLSFSAVNLL